MTQDDMWIIMYLKQYSYTLHNFCKFKPIKWFLNTQFHLKVPPMPGWQVAW